MRLAVIGDTQHYRDAEGRLCALEPVVNQLDRWADLFDEVVLCAPLAEGPPPPGFAPYRATNFTIRPLRSAGGNTKLAKFGLLLHILPWAWQTRRVARSVDAVHLRCPCNIGLVAIFSTWRSGAKRHAMYAGVWHDYAGEPRFFRMQRRLLADRRFGGPVSVYADRDPVRPHLEPFFSPSFSRSDWEHAGAGADAKIERIESGELPRPLRLVTVGRLTPNKNQRTVVLALAEVLAAGVDAHLDVYGDGPCRPELEELAAELGVGEHVTFHGSVDHGRVMQAFAEADLNLHSTRQEGYGKVLLESMVHATVPIFGESPVSGELSGDGTRGLVFPPDDHRALGRHVVDLVGEPQRWAKLARAGREHTTSLTLDAFQERLRTMLEHHWGVSLPEPRPAPDA